MKTSIKKMLAILTVMVFLFSISIVVSATHEFNVNADFDAYGNEIIDIRDLVKAEYQSKSDSFLLQLRRILLEIEELPIKGGEPTTDGGIYLPVVP